MTRAQEREPMTFDEEIVGFLEIETGCVTEEAVIPPPDDCSAWVQSAYGFAQWHLMTGVIIFVFLLMIFQLSMLAFNLFKK